MVGDCSLLPAHLLAFGAPRATARKPGSSQRCQRDDQCDDAQPGGCLAQAGHYRPDYDQMPPGAQANEEKMVGGFPDARRLTVIENPEFRVDRKSTRLNSSH